MKRYVILGLLAAQFGCSSAGVTPASGNVAFPIGVSPGSGFEQLFAKMSSRDQRAVLELMKADGVAWLRIDYYPNDSGLRHFIESARREGINADVILEDYAATPAQFAVFARNAAAKLDSPAYEILNEVNLYKPAIPAAKYVPVLQAAYRSIKQAAPHAIVLASGLGPGTGAAAPDRYLEAMYKAGAKGYFDAANLHPYSYPAMPMSSPCQSWNTFCHGAPAMRSVMVKYQDDATPIWFTEFGCPTGTAGGYSKACTDEQLAAQLTQAYAQSRKWSWVAAFFVFDWQDNDVDGDFGLYRANGDPKPYALGAFRRSTVTL
jgi:polysaccharide biosynthesis protein PslG